MSNSTEKLSNELLLIMLRNTLLRQDRAKNLHGAIDLFKERQGYDHIAMKIDGKKVDDSVLENARQLALQKLREADLNYYFPPF